MGQVGSEEGHNVSYSATVVTVDMIPTSNIMIGLFCKIVSFEYNDLHLLYIIWIGYYYIVHHDLFIFKKILCRSCYTRACLLHLDTNCPSTSCSFVSIQEILGENKKISEMPKHYRQKGPDYYLHTTVCS